MNTDELSPLHNNFVETSTALANAVKDISESKNNYSLLQADNIKLNAEIEDLKRQLAMTFDEVKNGNVQALLDSKGEGATIKFPPALYRLSVPLNPKNNQRIFAEGSTFKGSVVIGTWEREGNYYIASGLLPGSYADAGVCEIITGEEANGCRVLEDVFNKGVKLERVMQLSKLSLGKVYSDYASNKIYIMDVPDNVELSKTRFFMNSSAENVYLYGANVSQFASPSQQGALTIKGKGWEVDNCFFAYNHSSGLHVAIGDGLYVHHSTFDKNGQAGMTHYKTNDSVVEYNVFTNNNTSDYYRRDWESAGFKMTYSQRVKFRFNRSESNTGIGVWADIDNKDISVTDNIIKNNFSCGVRWEISFDGVIARNTIIGNGFGHAGPGRGSDYSAFATAAIHINGAGGMGDGIIDIYSNNIGLELVDGKLITTGRGNQNAIHIEERNRGKSQTYPVNWTARNVKVHDNTINVIRAIDPAGKPWYGTGVVGMGALNSPVSDVYAAGNNFENNKYYTNNISDTQFHVKDTAVNQYKTFARWQALGYDKFGSITLVTE